ncbi:MAG: DUF2254 domain-containing protein [Actinomycetota bacterium]|jgi:uncharacterized membrane protein|nr:DUF2254 domain-containing protein [Actinomycetota bacterium]
MWQDRVRAVGSSFWFIPAVCATAAVVLAVVLVRIDDATDGDALPVLFPGGPSGARALLGSITASMISFTGLVFSITIVVLQLTSSQFSPRILRSFLQDRASQAALGVFVATFVYAMTVLRSVRGESTDAPFVPRIATTMSFVLVIASVALFIYYIHHIANMIRAATILASVGGETRKLLAQRYPKDRQALSAPLHPVRQTVCAPGPGVVTTLSAQPLTELAAEADCVVELIPAVGTFVPEGAPLFHVRRDGGRPAPDLDEKAVLSTVTFDIEPSMEQDVSYGFRQLTDVAERVLSPSLNDHTTAVQAIDQIHDLLRRLASCPMPERIEADEDGVARVIEHEVGIDHYLDVGVDQIARWADDSPRVLGRLRAMLADVETVARPEHLAAIRRHDEHLARLEASIAPDD